jgi:hypothetical protein
MGKCLKATPEELEQHVRSRSARGMYFELICRYCGDAGSISATSSTWGRPEHKRKAAEKFAKQGWRMEAEIPVCPDCFAHRLAQGKYSPDEINQQ